MPAISSYVESALLLHSLFLSHVYFLHLCIGADDVCSLPQPIWVAPSIGIVVNNCQETCFITYAFSYHICVVHSSHILAFRGAQQYMRQQCHLPAEEKSTLKCSWAPGHHTGEKVFLHHSLHALALPHLNISLVRHTELVFSVQND